MSEQEEQEYTGVWNKNFREKTWKNGECLTEAQQECTASGLLEHSVDLTGVEKAQLRRSWADNAEKITEKTENGRNRLTQQEGEYLLTGKEVSFEEAIRGLCQGCLGAKT